jgi:hypothetical protein
VEDVGVTALRLGMDQGHLLARAMAELPQRSWSPQSPSLQVLRDWLLEQGLSLPPEHLTGVLHRHWLLGHTQRICTPIDPDSVSRLVLTAEAGLLALANATVWPFQMTYPPATLPFLTRLVQQWTPGALSQAFDEASRGWRTLDIPRLAREDGHNDSEFDPHLEALAVEVSPRGVFYVTIGTQGALQLRDGAIVARTPMDDLRTLRGLEGALGDVVARTLSEDTPPMEPHQGSFELLPGDSLALFPGSALRRAPGLPFSPDGIEAFRLEHRLPHVVAIWAPWNL